MNITPKDCCILNGGSGAWAFEPLAGQLSAALGIEVSAEPRRFNYLLSVEHPGQPMEGEVFIPIEAIRVAADKRLLAAVFRAHGVPTPQTVLLETFEEVLHFVRAHSGREWCLKFPTGCGASGHRLVTAASDEPPRWPRPFIVQEFIRLERPEVYRVFCAAGALFGWVVRRYPEGKPASPWVAHARGARYVRLGERPPAANTAAWAALTACGLENSFGCVDLLHRPDGAWVVLETGTDGLHNHVDRDLGDAELERELQERIATAFWAAAARLGDGIRGG